MYKELLSKPIVPQIICLFLFGLIIWQITAGMFAIYQYKSRNGPAIVKKKSLKPQFTVSESMLNSPLFGEYIPESLNEIQQSILNLQVVGIIFADNEQQSQVIIRLANEEEALFKVNDTLPGGAIIKKITKDGVLVLRNGMLESLSFPKNELTFEPPAKALIR